MINCAIIGCGKIAGGYDKPNSNSVRTHAKAFLEHPDTQLVGVCDVDQIKANIFAKTWGVNFATDNCEVLFKTCKPDLLSICSPTESHFEIFEQACNYRVPIIWLEKPASSSLDEVEKMIKLAEKSKTKVWVNYFRHYDAGLNKIKNKIKDLGEIQHVNAFYTKGLLHNGSHLIDLIHWFFGEVEEVMVYESSNHYGYFSITGMIVTKKARIYLKDLNYKKFELFEMDIIGSNGRIKIYDGGQKIMFENIVESKYYEGYRNLNLQELHDSSYSKSMLSGLKRGLLGEKMPSLKNDLQIQHVIRNII